MLLAESVLYRCITTVVLTPEGFDWLIFAESRFGFLIPLADYNIRLTKVKRHAILVKYEREEHISDPRHQLEAVGGIHSSLSFSSGLGVTEVGKIIKPRYCYLTV